MPYYVVENFTKNVETHKTYLSAEDACHILNAHQNEILEDSSYTRVRHYSVGKDPSLNDNSKYDVASEPSETNTEYCLRMGHDI